MLDESSQLPSRRVLLIIFGGFLALTLAIYGRSLTHEFVRWDGGLLITENGAVQEISTRSIAWVFSHYDPELYIPLTFLSYQFDYLIGGGSPIPFHITNLLLHTLNAFLVFLFISLLTRKQWLGLSAALLFAVHPLNTEAVAWASARKDALSGTFFLLSICAYCFSYGGGVGRWALGVGTLNKWYLVSVGAFFLGLLSKVSIIMLPFVLILIDVHQGRERKKKMLTDKLPYLILAIVFGIVALYGKHGIADRVPLFSLFLLSARSTVFYLQKIVMPTGLTVLYPAGNSISLFDPAYIVPIIVLVLLAPVLFLLRKRRFVLFGACFFLIMVIPSFMNAAKDADFFFASDRYAYLASIGAFLALISLIFSLCRDMRFLKGGILIISLALSIMAYRQSLFWRDTVTLFDRAVAMYPRNNLRAYHNLGNVYRRLNQSNEAISMFERALSIQPRAKTYNNLGAVYRKQGKILEALEQYSKAIALEPEDPGAYFGLGLVYAEQGDMAQAIASYRKAVELDPYYAEALSNIGAIYASGGDFSQAIEYYSRAIEANSLFTEAYFNFGVALTKLGKNDEAIRAYESALHIHPGLVPVKINLGILLYNRGDVADAKKQFLGVIQLDPNNSVAKSALAQIGS